MAGRAEDIVAQRILASVRDDLKKEMAALQECNTAECKRIKEQYEKALADSDSAALQKLDKLDKDIVQMIETMEKQYTTPIEVPPCPHCGFDADEKPKVVGHCPNGHCDVDEFDKKQGAQRCIVCGDEIEWD